MKGFVVGKEIKTYIPREEKNKENPQAKTSRTLHVVWDKPRRPVEGMEGFKCEPLWVSFEIPDINVGDYCEFEFEPRGQYVSLVDITVLGKADILLEAPKV